MACAIVTEIPYGELSSVRIGIFAQLEFRLFNFFYRIPKPFFQMCPSYKKLYIKLFSSISRTISGCKIPYSARVAVAIAIFSYQFICLIIPRGLCSENFVPFIGLIPVPGRFTVKFSSVK